MLENPQPSHPIVVELGKVGRKRIKDLKVGRGKLLLEVHEALDSLRLKLADEVKDKELVPVIVLYKKKGRKRRSGWPFLSW
jgi:hypothetical protein